MPTQSTIKGFHRYLLGTALAMAFVGCRLLFESGLLGSGRAETYGHAWRQWWTASALPNWSTGPGTRLWNPVDLPLIDPLPTLISASIGRILGVEFGYNTWILLSIGLAFIGGVCLARRLGGDPLTGGTVLALSPPLLGSLNSGLTEDGAVGLVAISMALIGDRDWKRGALGGLLLGVSAFCGLVLAWAGGVMACVLGLGIIIHDRSRWKSLLAGAVGAIFLAWPAALLQGARITGEGHRSGLSPPRPPDLWPLNPIQGVDLASLIRPGRFDAGDALIHTHPGWLGIVALGLGIMAFRTYRFRTLPLWSFLGIMICWSLGEQLYWTGTLLEITNPSTTLMTQLPFGELINHHARLLIVASVALAGLASLGAMHFVKGRQWIPLVILIEMIGLSPLSPILGVASSTAPDVLQQIDALPAGPLLVLPISGPGVHFQRPFLDQRVHERTLVADPQRPGLPTNIDPDWRASESAAWLEDLAYCLVENPPSHHRCTPPATFIAPPDIALIYVPSDMYEVVRPTLGIPAEEGEDGAVWNLLP